MTEIPGNIRLSAGNLPPSTLTLLCRSLNYGGAERQIVELAKGLKQLGCSVNVLTFYSGGELESDLITAGVQVLSLGKKGRWDIVFFLYRLRSFIRSSGTNIIYAFLGVPCIISLAVKLTNSKLSVVWGVRASDMDLSKYDKLTRFSYWLECFLSRNADWIIANSEVGRLYALSNGFPVTKTSVIPNGINTDHFLPDPCARQKIRKEFALSDEEIVIGLVARLDPMKDHPVFFKAAVTLMQQNLQVRFLCVGDGNESYRTELHTLAEQSGLGSNLIWVGSRNDMPSIYNALDILVSTSYTEGFPNVIAEAMACGVPCVVTDVGDSRLIVGDTGFVVPPKQPDVLAQKIQRMIELLSTQREKLILQTRDRIVKNFSANAMVMATYSRLSELK